ncbi:DNA polymerase III subunit delta [Segatella maculosa]|uniref:DNA polymerase III subunit delta n=1 Tax=Segatella maculosa TaxID=439703 RepID=UPI00248F6F23|nr:DNA polymerase III subunit delta [Segatella maculosa]
MPEKKNTGTSYETIMRDLKARHFSPIYILMGDESYYIDKISDYIAEHVLRPEERDFNQTVVFGSDISASQIVDSAKAFPMMAEKRVVIVKEAQNLKGTEPLVKYFKQPVVSTVLVLCHKNGSIDKRKKIIPAAQVGGAVIFESKKFYERELPGFIISYFMQHEITVEQKAAQMIADHVGADLHRLTSELDKILISFSEIDRMVTPEIVEKEIGVSKDFNAFELRSAIIQRDVYKANLITKYFDNNPKAGSLFSFLPMLFSYFENLMIAFYSPNRSNENALAQFLELRNGWAARDYLTGMRNYSGMKTMQIISKIREIDAKSKGLDNPNTASSELMKELIFFILH